MFLGDAMSNGGHDSAIGILAEYARLFRCCKDRKESQEPFLNRDP
jgi:hypothetical protein